MPYYANNVSNGEPSASASGMPPYPPTSNHNHSGLTQNNAMNLTSNDFNPLVHLEEKAHQHMTATTRGAFDMRQAFPHGPHHHRYSPL
jgi:hypothetical protein